MNNDVFEPVDAVNSTTVAKAYVFLTTFKPLVVARRVGNMDAEQMRALLADYQRELEMSSQKTALVYDASTNAMGRPDAVGRQLAGEWLRDQTPLLAARCSGFDFSVPNAASRGTITAVFWIGEPTIPTALHSSPLEAITTAISRLERCTLDPAKVLAALDALTAQAQR